MSNDEYQIYFLLEKRSTGKALSESSEKVCRWTFELILAWMREFFECAVHATELPIQGALSAVKVIGDLGELTHQPHHHHPCSTEQK